MKALPFFLSLLLLPGLLGAQAARHVVLVTLDGVRCQEWFQGMDPTIWQAKQPDEDITATALYQRFWAETEEARREKLLPFFWGDLMKNHGAVAGNRFQGSVMTLSNRHRFSYPGYSELLTGVARDREIRSNEKIQNPHPTVLEFVRSELALEASEVAAFACWDVMDWIVEHQKGSIVSNAGFEAYATEDPVLRRLSDLQFETPTPWDSVRHDVYTFRFAMDYLERHRPRFLYISLGETDDWAHDNRYDRVLQALHRTDGYLRELWQWLQSQDEYRGRTALFIGTDHGRGDNEFNWMHHNDKMEGARFVWFAAAGSGVTVRGEHNPGHPLSQNQIAATVAASLGLDYSRFNPEAGAPMTWFTGR